MKNIDFRGSIRAFFKSGDCPCCGAYVDTDDDIKFCTECGQKLNWKNSDLTDQLNKDKLIVEYTSLCVEFSTFAGPDPVDAEREEQVINRLFRI